VDTLLALAGLGSVRSDYLAAATPEATS
jgi:hypothetical protein